MTYVAAIIGDNPQNYWRLNEGPGATLALDYGLQPGDLQAFVVSATTQAASVLPGFGFNGITADGGAMNTVGGGVWSPIGTGTGAVSRYHSVPDPGTLEFWYFSESSFDNFFVGWLAPHASGGATALGFTVADNLLTWNILGPGGPQVGVSPLSQWHHVAATWSLGSVSIYLDGAQLALAAQPSNVAGTAVAPAIGPFTVNDTGLARNGLVSEAATYRRSLTLAQLQAHIAQAELKGQRPHWLGPRITISSGGAPPLATYTRGVTHSGLTGTGVFTVPTGLRGLAIDITTPPTGTRVLPGVPAYTYDVGWLSVLDASGMIAEIRPNRDTRTWLPDNMGLATTVGYALGTAVVIDVTELDPA